MRLLPPKALVKTGPVDHADWNYRRTIGYVQRRRFALALGLLPRRSARVLEIGYGSGIFMPALAARTAELHGADIHESPAAVAASLTANGIPAMLVTASAERLPYPDGFFHAVVAISAFEFIAEPQRAAAEIRRVLTPDGVAVIVMPGSSPLLDVALRITTGESAERDYEGRRAGVLPAFERSFTLERVRAFPPLLGRIVPVYRAYRFRPKLTTGAAAGGP